jgi:hypothetical protein
MRGDAWWCGGSGYRPAPPFHCMTFFLLFLEGLGVHEPPHRFSHKIHDKNSTDHASISKGGTTVKSRQAGIRRNLFGCCNKVSINLTFNIALHASFNGIKRMRLQNKHGHTAMNKTREFIWVTDVSHSTVIQEKPSFFCQSCPE